MNCKSCNALTGIAWGLLAGFTLFLAGCSTPVADTGTTHATAAPPTGAAAGQKGALLWAQTCGHCHNIRSPSSYSDAQWDITMLHMRVRANLTAEEHREITAFLKSAH